MNWRALIVVLIALAIGMTVLFNIAVRPPTPPIHEVFVNGQVLTMDANNAIVEALSVRDGTIEAVGSTDAIMAGVSDDTIVNDLRGRTLLPGFIDAHGHFPGSGLAVVSADLTSPPVGTHTTMAELLATMKAQAAQTEPGEWVSGFGYDDTLLAEHRHPTRAELDSVSTEHPIAVMHVSGHMLVANSMALDMVGIDADTPDPEGGVIGRRPGSREPNGLLEETARMEVMNAQQDIGIGEFYAMIKYASAEYAALGVTTAQSGGATPEMLNGLALFSKYSMIPIRLVLFAFEDAYRDLLSAGEFSPEALQTEMFSAPAVKIVADGSIQGYTGYLSKPYHVPYHGDPGYRGYPAVLRENLFDIVARLHRGGYQMAIHGNGDASIEDILDAFEAAQ
ncbi:MAG: amidohydrolase family protein, partial [Pseudomonadota bacterium]